MANSNTPQDGQWFYIQSNATDSIGKTYVANVEGADRLPGANIILWPLQPNSYNVLWRYYANMILTAVSPLLLALDLGGEGNTEVVLNNAAAGSSMQWIFNEDGTITNQSNGLVLSIAGGDAQSGASLVASPAGQTPPAAQQWSVVYPQTFVPKWCYIQSALTEDLSKPLVATLQQGTTNVVLSSMQASSSNQLWQIAPDGRILSATPDMNYYGNPVMAPGAQLGGGQNGNYMGAFFPPVQTDPTLQWIFNEQNMFINASNGLALNVQGSVTNQNTPLITYAVQSGPPKNEVWSISPSSVMTDIMAAPPVAFPVFTGDQETAYTSICQQLNVTDLRSEYPILDSGLSNYLSLLQGPNLQRPPGVTVADWNCVVAQLTKELMAAIDIQLLFSNYGSFDNERYSIQDTTLNQLFADAGMDQGSKTESLGGIFLSVFEGLIYTGIEALPEQWPVLGNLMETAISISLSAANRGGGSISPNPFYVAYSDLAGELSGNFAALLTTMGNMEDAILKDWGKMQATYIAIGSTGPDSLAWPDTLPAALVNASLPGYKISVMQMLLPAKYQIFVYLVNENSAVPGAPESAQWIQQVADNQWCKYWIATPGDWSEYPSDEAMSDVWDSGVARSEFFLGLDGWGFARTFPVYENSSIGTDCHHLVITITNQTPNPLIATASPTPEGTVTGPTSQTLQPYGSASFVGKYEQGLAVDFAISDPNLVGSSQVASFTGHQHKCSTAAGDVWIDSQQIHLGYQLTTPICYRGSFAKGFAGAAQIGICLAPINPPPSN
jgi:hypothetical protein